MLGCDVSAFSCASLPEWKMFKMYIGEAYLLNPRPSLVVLFVIYAFLLQLTVFKACSNNDFNEFIPLVGFLKYFPKNVKGG